MSTNLQVETVRQRKPNIIQIWYYIISYWSYCVILRCALHSALWLWKFLHYIISNHCQIILHCITVITLFHIAQRLKRNLEMSSKSLTFLTLVQVLQKNNLIFLRASETNRWPQQIYKHYQNQQQRFKDSLSNFKGKLNSCCHEFMHLQAIMKKISGNWFSNWTDEQMMHGDLLCPSGKSCLSATANGSKASFGGAKGSASLSRRHESNRPGILFVRVVFLVLWGIAFVHLGLIERFNKFQLLWFLKIDNKAQVSWETARLGHLTASHHYSILFHKYVMVEFSNARHAFFHPIPSGRAHAALSACCNDRPTPSQGWTHGQPADSRYSDLNNIIQAFVV